jgi:hypothetical protein
MACFVVVLCYLWVWCLLGVVFAILYVCCTLIHEVLFNKYIISKIVIRYLYLIRVVLTIEKKVKKYMKTIKKITAITLMLALVIGCFAAMPLQANATATPEDIVLLKTVDGTPIRDWIAANHAASQDAILAGISFDIHALGNDKVTRLNAPQNGELDADSYIAFTFAQLELTRGGPGYLTRGWYVIEETLDGASAAVIEQPAEGKNSVTFWYDGYRMIGPVIGFNYDDLYTIGYSFEPVSGRDQISINYPQVNGKPNGGGEIFSIWVNDDHGNRYDSFCAHCGSKSFAGDSYNELNRVDPCEGYMVASQNMPDEQNALGFDVFISVYNYINDEFGNLNDNRLYTQVLTWALLGDIELSTEKLEQTNLSGAQIADILDIWNNGQTYMSTSEEGRIIDLVYMTCKKHGTSEEGLLNCQPQLVPIYGNRGDKPNEFANKALPPQDPEFGALEVSASASLKTISNIIQPIRQKTWQPWVEYTQTVSQGYSSVTATTKYQFDTVKPSLLDAKGKINDKASAFNDLVVKNSNHFTFAKLSRADLAAGVELALVVGNNIDYVGAGTAKIVDGKLVLSFDPIYKATFGAYVSTTAFNPKNGNVHSEKDFKHNNVAVLDLPSGNGDIYLYVHFDNLQFDFGTQQTGCGKDLVSDLLICEKRVGKKVDSSPVEVIYEVLDANGDIVAEADFAKLPAGEYKVVFYDSYLDESVARDVVVVAGETTTVEYNETHKTCGEPIVKDPVYVKPIIKDLETRNKLVVKK